VPDAEARITLDVPPPTSAMSNPLYSRPGDGQTGGVAAPANACALPSRGERGAGAPDVVDDLPVLGALKYNFVVGSMNRGGPNGARSELDDRFPAHSAAAMFSDRLHGDNFLVRVDSRTRQPPQLLK
jgi:hypothetical protein